MHKIKRPISRGEGLILVDMEVGSYSGPLLAREVFREEPKLGEIFRTVSEKVKGISNFNSDESVYGITLETRTDTLLMAEIALFSDQIDGELMGQLMHWDDSCYKNYFDQLDTVHNINEKSGEINGQSIRRREWLKAVWQAGIFLARTMWGDYKKGMGVDWDQIDFNHLAKERWDYNWKADGGKWVEEGPLTKSLYQCLWEDYGPGRHHEVNGLPLLTISI